MTIAVASGKGGVGKTMLATSLAVTLAREHPTLLLDLDVEEPNAHLFLDAPCTTIGEVTVMQPRIEEEFCNHCGLCQKICAFHALLVLPDQVVVFPELCKSCRGCVVLCPMGAVVDDAKRIGVVEQRALRQLTVLTGRLDVGATEAPALIREVKSRAGTLSAPVDTAASAAAAMAADVTVIDAPPGCGCAAVEAVRGADCTILVTEPTPFGLHDLDLTVRTLREFRQQVAVVLNKAVPHDDSVQRYCRAENIPLLASIPQSEDIARACAHGWLLPRAVPWSAPLFLDILERTGAFGEVHA
ncbi:MAG: ATP-binding protein [Bacteroidia bacterium]|nr:ATP-binding protein [Bacteroidia bacterium]